MAKPNPDPIYAAIEHATATRQAFRTAMKRDDAEGTPEARQGVNAASDIDTEVHMALYATSPTTLAGMRAMLKYLSQQAIVEDITSGDGLPYVLRSLLNSTVLADAA